MAVVQPVVIVSFLLYFYSFDHSMHRLMCPKPLDLYRYSPYTVDVLYTILCIKPWPLIFISQLLATYTSVQRSSQETSEKTSQYNTPAVT